MNSEPVRRLFPFEPEKVSLPFDEDAQLGKSDRTDVPLILLFILLINGFYLANRHANDEIEETREEESVLMFMVVLQVHCFLFTICYLPFTIAFMRRAIYPGSFDPVTNGHLDIIERGCKLFDEIIIAILVNPEKRPFFTIEERRDILSQVLKQIDHGACSIRVDDFEGLLVQYAVAQKADAIVRGIRAISDYEYELQMALMNRRLEPSIETVFMMPAETYSYVSSRLVKEVFQLGGELDGLVPPLVESRMKEKLADK